MDPIVVGLACTVSNVLVPGLGSVVNALVEVGKLCMDMKENQHACVRVEKRFGEIHTQLLLMEQRDTLPKNDAINRYTDALERFYLFLKRQRKKNVIQRLVAAKGVLDKIQDFHEDVDHLFKMLNLAHVDAMMSWQREWEKDKLQQQLQLEAILGNTGMLLKELYNQKAQVEALAQFKIEFERMSPSKQGVISGGSADDTKPRVIGGGSTKQRVFGGGQAAPSKSTLGPVANALVEIDKLCMEMKESQQLFTSVAKRLGELYKHLSLMEQRSALPKDDVVRIYTYVLERFYLFLKKQPSKSVILRLAASKRMVDRVRQFHEDLDQLFKLMEISNEGNADNWELNWEKETALYQQELKKLVGDAGLLMKELDEKKAQEEALTLLKFEIKRTAIGKKQRGDDGVALMKLVLTKASSISKVKAEKIPEWFLPPDDVDFDDVPQNRGPFGTVHRGILGAGTSVIVKRLPNETMTRGQTRDNFFKECDIWHSMDHPNVLKMFGACHVSSPPLIVCEYADHGSLVDLIAQKGTTRGTALKLLYQTSQGLCYLHGRNIVHGDLKCSNILVSGDSAKLTAFEFSFIRRRASFLTAKTQSASIQWKAPELLAGGIPSQASDVYSFAMCILEVLTGDTPWSTLDDDMVSNSVKDGQPPPRPKGVDDEIWRLIQQMCTKSPTRRLKLKHVAEQLNKMFLTEQQREINARLRSSTISDDIDESDTRLRCIECQFPVLENMNSCGRCGRDHEVKA